MFLGSLSSATEAMAPLEPAQVRSWLFKAGRGMALTPWGISAMTCLGSWGDTRRLGVLFLGLSPVLLPSQTFHAGHLCLSPWCPRCQSGFFPRRPPPAPPQLHSASGPVSQAAWIWLCPPVPRLYLPHLCLGTSGVWLSLPRGPSFFHFHFSFCPPPPLYLLSSVLTPPPCFLWP